MAGRYVEREIVNHSMLLHPHIIQFKEVSFEALSFSCMQSRFKGHHATATSCRW